MQNPRELQNAGTMVFFHSKYRLGDNHKFTIEEAQKFETTKDVLSLPVYMYDHSGITISTKPFSCPWDSGKIGFIYITKQQARKLIQAKRLSKKDISTIKQMLNNEVKTYDAYLQG